MTMPLVDLGTSSFILFAVIMQEKICLLRRSREPSRRLPLKELSRVKLRRLRRLNTFQEITRNLPKFLIDTRRAHVNVNVHVNTRAKENPIKAVMRSQS